MILCRIRHALSCRCELWSALIAISWSKIVYWYDADIGTQPNYAGATLVFSSVTWDVLAFTVGCIQIVSLLSLYRWARAVGALTAAWFWLTLGFSFFLNVGTTPGLVLYLGLGLAQVHSTLANLVSPKR